MLMSTPESIRRNSELASDLQWLKSEHPDREALITLVKSVLNTIKQAGSVDSAKYPLEFGECIYNSTYKK
jgi:hypothetical protein